MNTKKSIVGIALACLISLPSYAEQASSESIKALMEQTGAKQMGQQVIQYLIPNMKQMVPQAPAEFWQDIMAAAEGDELVDMLVPVYQKHLSEEDVNALVEFYSSDVGKKMLKVQPQIMQESMVISQKWGEKVAIKALSQYNDDGVKK